MNGKKLVHRAIEQTIPKKYQPMVTDSFRLIKFECWRLLTHGFRDMPLKVNIETHNFCTRHCWYCNRLHNTSPIKFMSTVMYQKIIREFVAVGYRGPIHLHSFNEPLLDPRLIDLVKYAKAKLIRSDVNIFTNGDRLDNKKIIGLRDAKVDQILVAIHEPTKNEQADKLYSFQEQYPGFVRILEMRDQRRKNPLGNRGDENQFKEKKRKEIIWQYIYRCYNVYTLVIRHDGTIDICCQDGPMAYPMGNIEDGIMKVWNSPEFRRLRFDVHYRRKFLHPLCKNCGYQIIN